MDDHPVSWMRFEGEQPLDLAFVEDSLVQSILRDRQSQGPGHVERQVAEAVPEGEQALDRR